MILPTIRKQFRLNWWGHHGVRHWARVRRNGHIIAQHTPGVDLAVLDLFAVLHDAARHDEDEDPSHGWRAMAHLRKLHSDTRLGLSDGQFHTLLIAIERHSDPRATPYNVTMAACWNADRLDLGRVGITPDKRFMYAEALPPDDIIAAIHQSAQCERHKQRSLHDPRLLLP